jgi:hypothetical protein
MRRYLLDTNMAGLLIEKRGKSLNVRGRRSATATASALALQSFTTESNLAPAGRIISSVCNEPSRV